MLRPVTPRKKLFIVEDSRIISLELQKILEGLGYAILGTAMSGEEAITECARTGPDLILMDVRLAGKMSGIEASREIRKNSNVPVIFTTAYSDRTIIEEIQRSFPFGFVIKPYREKDLLVAIETAFTRYEYEKKLEQSERKYKSLFEGSSDVIFTMDERWNIRTVNWAAMNHLNLRPDDLIDKNFLDLMHVSEDNMKTIDFIPEKLEMFLRNKHPLNFKTTFKSNFNNEPVEMSVRLEYINAAEGDLIMCRAFRVVDDELLKFFTGERQTLVMGNQLFLVSDVAYRLTRNLKRYIDTDAVELTRLALVEIIINAIEHGNLEITFEEKTEAMGQGNYFEYVTKRQNNPRYRDRSVYIESHVGDEQAVYSITDDGAGFDHASFFSKEMSDINYEFRPHGRGLLMTKKLFDEITYNAAGNRVTLVKKYAVPDEDGTSS